MTVKITVNGKEFDSINEAVEYARGLDNGNPVYRPKVGDKYFTTYSDGNAYCVDWTGQEYDLARLSHGNVFKTKEDAEKEMKRRKVYQRLKKLAGGYEYTHGNTNYFIYWGGISGEFEVCMRTRARNMNTVYFETEVQAQAAIDELGDDLMVLFE